MKSTGERFVKSLSGLIELEHFNRYLFVVNQLNLENKIVLDIASGEGYGSEMISQKAKKVYGVDISEETILYSQKTYRKENLQFLVGSVDQIPIESKSIDIVVSFETIEHHNMHIEMFKEIKRVLKPNGLLVISSPDKINYSQKYHISNHFHIKELSKEEFHLLIDAFFKFKISFIQRTFCGSLIQPEFFSDIKENAFIIDGSKQKEFLKPLFNIAIASDSEIDLNASQWFYSDDDKYDIYPKNLVNSLYNSYTWKTGSFFIKPLQAIKNLFKNKNA